MSLKKQTLAYCILAAEASIFIFRQALVIWIDLDANDEPTRLPRARTPSFKALHGDWETLSRAKEVRGMKPVGDIAGEKLTQKEMESKFTEFGIVVNNTDGRPVSFPKETAGKIIRHGGVQTARVAASFNTLFQTSIPAWSEQERVSAGHKHHPNIKAYHNYVNKIELDGREYYIRFTVREEKVVKTRRQGKNEVHSSAISDVSIYTKDGESERIGQNNPGEQTTPSFVDFKLADWFDSVKPSSVRIDLDANGEPILNGAGVPLMDAPSSFKSMTVESKGTEATGKKISRPDLVKKAKELFPEVAFRGRATWRRKGVLGWFDKTNALIRSNDRNDIATIAHELGHYIDSATNTTDGAIPAEVGAELLRMGKELYPKEPPNGWRSEGMAEFMRKPRARAFARLEARVQRPA